MQDGWLFQLAAVVLVEGVLVSNWILLESRKSEGPEVKLRYALTVAVMYLGMLAVSLADGEGGAGLIFRVAFGLALIGSTWDTFAHTFAKLRSQAESDGAVS